MGLYTHPNWSLNSRNHFANGGSGGNQNGGGDSGGQDTPNLVTLVINVHKFLQFRHFHCAFLQLICADSADGSAKATANLVKGLPLQRLLQNALSASTPTLHLPRKRGREQIQKHTIQCGQ